MSGVAGLDRREFLKLGAVAGGGLVVGFRLPDVRLWDSASEPAVDPFEPNAFLSIDTDGEVTIWVGRVEMGQGVRTALPMIVADELDADWSRVQVVQADAHASKYGRQMTVGSTSVRRGAWMPLRQAGASAREMLVAAAAGRWGVDAAGCRTESGRVIHDASGRALAYGDLSEAAAALPVPGDPTLKDPSEFQLIGTSPPLVDAPLHASGRSTFGMDVQVPGMLHGTVVHSPVFGGSVASFDDSRARAVPGVRDVLKISRGLVVVADSTWAAFRGAETLDARWDEGDFAMNSAEISWTLKRLTEGAGDVAREEGDATAALSRASQASRRIQAAYEAPYLAHATMEPMVCTAHVRSDRCELWASTQNPQGAQRAAARLTGLPPEKVTVHVTYVGCGWGRRGATDYVDDAVEAAMQVEAPIKVAWTREEDMRHDFYRPAAFVRFEGSVDEEGRLDAIKARVAATPINGGRPGGSGLDRNSVDGIANAAYAIPNFFVDYCRPAIAVPTGYWRSVSASQNTFMMESFVDELAHAAGRDPVEFRLELLGHRPRLRRVLELAADKSGWSAPAAEGRARGVALVENKGGLVAEVAEVSVTNGRLRVHRVTCAADSGRIIHPRIAEAQMMGCIVGGLTAALHGEITLTDGRVDQENFDDYRLLRMDEMPHIDVHLVESDEEPGGVGEPALPPIAPAVTNAIFALTGTRVRKLPIRL